MSEQGAKRHQLNRSVSEIAEAAERLWCVHEADRALLALDPDFAGELGITPEGLAEDLAGVKALRLRLAELKQPALAGIIKELHRQSLANSGQTPPPPTAG